MKIEMTFKKETKRTVVFVNEEEGIAISQVYVQKTAFGGSIPKGIVLTLEVSEADQI